MDSYLGNAAELVGQVHAAEPAPGFTEVLAPGDLEARTREQREREGIPLHDDVWQSLLDAAASLGVAIADGRLAPGAVRLLTVAAPHGTGGAGQPRVPARLPAAGGLPGAPYRHACSRPGRHGTGAVGSDGVSQQPEESSQSGLDFAGMTL